MRRNKGGEERSTGRKISKHRSTTTSIATIATMTKHDDMMQHLDDNDDDADEDGADEDEADEDDNAHMHTTSVSLPPLGHRSLLPTSVINCAQAPPFVEG